MTWGELEGTPLRLDPEDDIAIQPSSGPQFRVPDVSRAASHNVLVFWACHLHEIASKYARYPVALLCPFMLFELDERAIF